MSSKINTIWILKKALAKMRCSVEEELADLEFHLATYDMADKEFVTAKRKAEIALHEFRVKEMEEKIEKEEMKNV